MKWLKTGEAVKTSAILVNLVIASPHNPSRSLETQSRM
jgi:hypothetical protein